MLNEYDLLVEMTRPINGENAVTEVLRPQSVICFLICDDVSPQAMHHLSTETPELRDLDTNSLGTFRKYVGSTLERGQL